MPNKATKANRRQNDRFLNAQSVRNALIHNLRQCNTAEALDVLFADYQNNPIHRVSSPFTARQQVVIKTLDTQIKDLAASKQREFVRVELDSVPGEHRSNPARIQEMKDVRAKLQILVNKQQELHDKIVSPNDQYDQASIAAQNLIEGMKRAHEEYVTNRIEKPELIRRAEQLLADDNADVKVLDTHRGCKQILVDLLTAVAGLVVFYGVAAAIKGSFTIWSVSTDAGEKKNDLKQSVDALRLS